MSSNIAGDNKSANEPEVLDETKEQQRPPQPPLSLTWWRADGLPEYYDRRVALTPAVFPEPPETLSWEGPDGRIELYDRRIPRHYYLPPILKTRFLYSRPAPKPPSNTGHALPALASLPALPASASSSSSVRPEPPSFSDSSFSSAAFSSMQLPQSFGESLLPAEFPSA